MSRNREKVRKPRNALMKMQQFMCYGASVLASTPMIMSISLFLISIADSSKSRESQDTEKCMNEYATIYMCHGASVLASTPTTMSISPFLTPTADVPKSRKGQDTEECTNKDATIYVSWGDFHTHDKIHFSRPNHNCG